MPRFLVLAALVACAAPTPPPAVSPASPQSSSTAASPSRTRWSLEPHQAFDALCVVNLLSGDPFYVERYRAELAPYDALLTADERAAAGRISARIKKAGGVPPAQLALVFSVLDVRTLDDLIAVVGDDQRWAELRRRFLASRYAEGDDFAAMNDVRADLGVALGFLARAGFAERWTRTELPRIEAYIASGAAEVARFDVVGADERILGRRLDVDVLTAYVLAYARPHGVRVTGWRFLTDVSYPIQTTVKTALHELLHPPFAPGSPALAAMAALERDPFLQRLVREHDPSFGYTTAAGLLEEDCVTAVHVHNAVAMGLLADPAAYFAAHDDGIHVVAFILYRALERADMTRWTTYDAFIAELAASGALAPGQLQATFEADPQHYPVAALAPR
jgi:hypothetical protein